MLEKLRSPDEIIIKGVKLSEILEEHRLWVESNGESGTYADLSSADLHNTDLQKVILEEAELLCVNLQKADLRWANLWGAKLWRADLRESNLKNANLRETNLQEANFRNANLWEANLQNADLLGANLQWARLQGAKLQDAELQGAQLGNANLQLANLLRADFLEAQLQWAQLQDAKLQDAKLRGANLRDTKFNRANLRSASLRRVDLQGADLKEAKLQGADLQEAKLRDANLVECDLRSTILNFSDLRFANLRNANITGSNIYAAATTNWKIEGIKCDYIFTDAEGKNRYPKDRNFEEGEFERLYSSIPTVEYVFEKGMNWFDPILMDYAAFKVDSKNPELGVSLLSFDRQGLYPKATFSVASEDKSELALKNIITHYEKLLEKAYKRDDLLLEIIRELSLQPRQLIQAPVSGTVIMADHEAQVKNINIGEVKINIEKIIETIEAEPAASFKEKGKGKKHVLDVLKGIISGLTVDKAPEIVEKVTELVNTLGPQIVDKIQPILDTLKSFV